MIVGDREYRWIVKGTHEGIPNDGVILYHSDKAGLTVNADGATIYDTIGDAMRKCIYRNEREKTGYVYRVRRIEINNENKD